MWDETLIESMGKGNNGKRWLTVQVAAIVHGGVVAILAAASFWYSDAMTLPSQFQPITPVFIADSLPITPVSFGVHHQKPQPNSASNNSKPVLQEVTQESIVAEDGNVVQSSTPFTDFRSLGDLPEGDPDGVDGGLPDGSGAGFVPGGSGSGPITPDQFFPLGIEQPVVLHRVEPAYPLTLLRMHKEGIVILQALITANGDVQKIEILKSDHELFSQSAINAVSQWKYRPAKLRNKPVAVYFTVTVVFRIK